MTVRADRESSTSPRTRKHDDSIRTGLSGEVHSAAAVGMYTTSTEHQPAVA
jgi:hypothetical protein